MANYRAPAQDYLFILHDFLKIEDRTDLPGFTDLTPDFTSAVIDAATTFHEEVLHPINQKADEAGAHFADGQVTTPAGFKAAWDAYREAGWHSLSLASELGGGGLPPVMSVPISEMRAATGHSFSMYGSFCSPAAYMLGTLAPDWVKTHVVPKLASGEWTATMSMTEPQAGTDLRQITTRAVPQEDGTWLITGNKIFISGGDHDLTDNIVHIVLAKAVDEEGRVPQSLSAVNVFLVSKQNIDPQTGVLGDRNGVHVRSIEHKMGIEASATCALDFENAVGYRIASTEGKGTTANMAPMFRLMNYARVGTAVSGIGYAEIALQNAVEYARERRSGRAASSSRDTKTVADPIIAHPDVRRLLLESSAFAEGARAGAMKAAVLQSEARYLSERAARQKAADILDLLTPVMKAFFTDRGFETTVACQQVFGGHGYVKDYGIERLVRNSRITQIYEGANGIHASDLASRKIMAHDRRMWNHFATAISEFIARHSQDKRLDDYVQPLEYGLQRLEMSIERLTHMSARNMGALEAGAYDLMTAVGVLYLGWMWAEIAAIVTDGQTTRFVDHQGRIRKLALAEVWMQRQMPLIDSLCRRIESGNTGLLNLPDNLI